MQPASGPAGGFSLSAWRHLPSRRAENLKAWTDDLAYCRWREPALLLHSGVGAARGRRSLRGAGGLRPDRLGRRSGGAGCPAFGGGGPAVARLGAGRDDPRGGSGARDQPHRRRHPLGEDGGYPFVDHPCRRMDPRRGQDGAPAVAARARGSCGRGRWRPATRRATTTCWAWIPTLPTPIPRWRRR